jgi:CubicO group peptidase (beta-lactamase class C family)
VAYLDEGRLWDAVGQAAQLPRIHALIVAHDGIPVAERVFGGPGPDAPVNIRSAAKSVISALVGVALERGLIKELDQPMLPLLKKRAPGVLDPRVAKVTIDHLLSMRAGLESTTVYQDGERWFRSPDWVSYALTRRFADEPGGGMIYSTGNVHLLSAILTEVSGVSTWELAQRWLGEPLGIAIPQWLRDPQGVYFGGDEMLLSPRDLLRFGAMYCSGGVHGGRQIVSREWIVASWTSHAFHPPWRSFGYGWFISNAWGHPLYYAWGFGGQVLCLAPSLKLTIVITCDPTSSMNVHQEYSWKMHQLIKTGLIPAAMQAPQWP